MNTVVEHAIAPDATGSAFAFRMTGICKSFGATRALEDVSLAVRPGEVLALIGENGAGKSTLMKVLSGAHAPDAGAMEIGGHSYRPGHPSEARLAGVGMIYQELNLALELSVEDNVMLGQELHTGGWLNRPAQRERVRAALALLGHPDLPLAARVGDLSIGQRQLVEIARALVSQCRVIVFDEPTSSLPRDDVERLFSVVRKLRDSGIGIVYISHFLEEIRAICDSYLVLRDGRVAGAGSLRLGDGTRLVTDREIVSLMIGRPVDDLFPRVPHTPGEEILRLENLSGVKLPTGVNLSLRRGEILGIAGLVGAGRTELLRALFALDPVRAGRVLVQSVLPAATPRARIAAGLGLVSEDRKTEGVALSRSIADNLTYSRLAPYAWWGWLNLARRRVAVVDWMQRLRVKAASPEQEVRQLSGGNQQKVALARILHQRADVLLLDEPTRGIDVGTKAEIYRLLGEQAAAGKGVLFVSSYSTELLAVCDRVAVLSRGELIDVRPSAEWTEEEVMRCAVSGGKKPS